MNVHHAELREPSYMHPTQAEISLTTQRGYQNAADVLQLRLLLDMVTHTQEASRTMPGLHTSRTRIVRPGDVVSMLGDITTDLRRSIDILEGREE
jgi:hypothetical protein